VPPVGLVASLTFTDQHYKAISGFIAPQEIRIDRRSPEFNVSAFKGRGGLDPLGVDVHALLVPDA
jgi:NADPH2:quinone reductase